MIEGMDEKSGSKSETEETDTGVLYTRVLQLASGGIPELADTIL